MFRMGTARLMAAISTLILIPSLLHAEQNLLDANASFATTDQSMWGTGSAFNFNYYKFLGVDSNPAPLVIGAGSGDTVSVRVPLVGTYQINPYQQYDTDFKVGIEIGASVNSGSINANLDYNLNLSAPDALHVGQKFSLTSTATPLNTSSFVTSPANASAYVDGVLETYLGAYVRVDYDQPGILPDQDLRLGNKGFTKNNTSNSPYSTLVNINKHEEIIGINRNASGYIRYLGGSDLTDGDLLYDTVGAGSSVSLGPIEFTAGNWNVIANGGLQGNSLVGSGQDTLMTMTLDIDHLILGSAALGYSLDHDWGAIDYHLGYDVVDVDAGLDINLQQNFNLNSIVLVQLNFSDNVLIDGVGEANTWFGAFENIPDITLLTSDVDVNTTFLVQAALQNDTGLGFVGTLDTTILEAAARIGWDISGNTGSRGFSVGPFYQKLLGIGLGDISVYNDTYELQGFNVVDGGSFKLSTVPIPAAAWLMLGGFGALGVIGRRRVASDCRERSMPG
ncbi:MAG: VPLPA-CTERM sorting domain-containing protein [Gammaproteobacteria bacterium]